MLLAGVGCSVKRNPFEAIQEAYDQATSLLQDNPPSLLLFFASPATYNQEEILAILKERSSDSVIIGCSTAGEISSIGGSLDSSIALMAIYSDTIKFVPGLGENIKDDPRIAGKAFADNIIEGENRPKMALIFPDGLAGNGADIVRGILEVLGVNFTLTGGSAGDDFQFKQSYEYLDGKVMSGSIVGVGMYGEFHYGIGVKHGWVPISTPRVATRSSGNTLYELDSKPAIQIYEDHFGKDKSFTDPSEPLARQAITYPLGIHAPNEDGYLVRDPITVGENGAINCAAEIPEGAEVYMMIGSVEDAMTAAEDAAKQASSQLGNRQPKAALLFSSVARKKLLMSHKSAEIDKIRTIIGEDVPLIGFYTYGEQAPLSGEVGTCSFHNETDVLLLLAE